MFLPWSSLKGSLANSETQAFPEQISLEIELLIKFGKDGGYFCFLCLLNFFLLSDQILNRFDHGKAVIDIESRI